MAPEANSTSLLTHTPTLEFSHSPEGGRRLIARQFLPRSRAELFRFFGDAFQLESLTPPLLHFRVVTPAPIVMRPGLTIDYRLKLRGVPMRWRSLIETWSPPERFVDVQLIGPYRSWRHEHLFEETTSGTWCTDIVDYRVPLGWLVEPWIVRPDLRRIFAYRQGILADVFPSRESEALSPAGPQAQPAQAGYCKTSSSVA